MYDTLVAVMPVTAEITVFWEMSPCSLVHINQTLRVRQLLLSSALVCQDT